MKNEVVEAAYDELTRAGISPSLRKLREHIGYGSLGDIHRVLVGIRTERSYEEAAAQTLPSELKDRCDRLLMQIWGAARSEAAEAIANANAAADMRIAEMGETLAGALADGDVLLADKDALAENAARLEEHLALEVERRTVAEQRLAVADQRCRDLDARIVDLQQALRSIGSKQESGKTVPRRKKGAITLKDVRQATEDWLKEHGVFEEVDFFKLPGMANVPREDFSELFDELMGAGIFEYIGNGDVRLPQPK
jgi:hypothetical protein